MAASRSAADWLPDLCRLPVLFAVMVVAELVVLVLALAPLAGDPWSIGRFAAASLFSQWLALSSAALLCVLRPWLARMPRRLGPLAAWSVPVAVAALGAWLVHQVDVGLGTGLTVPAASGGRFVAACAATAALIGAAALRYFYVQQQWRLQVQAQARAEVQALQARIRPHFLFNSMNSIASLVRRDPVTAERAIEDLSDLFRAALGAGQGEGTLGEELALCERYLAIEALRLGERLRVEWSLVEPLPRTLSMPRLALQPLLENAVVHGVARLADGGTIRIEAAVVERRLRLSVVNPVPPAAPPQPGNAHAQSGIAQRLAWHFGPEAKMTTRLAGGYYHCELSLPLEPLSR